MLETEVFGSVNISRGSTVTVTLLRELFAWVETATASLYCMTEETP
nr:hypothetical protein [uncultured Draconibacterium sp.]